MHVRSVHVCNTPAVELWPPAEQAGVTKSSRLASGLNLLCFYFLTWPEWLNCLIKIKYLLGLCGAFYLTYLVYNYVNLSETKPKIKRTLIVIVIQHLPRINVSPYIIQRWSKTFGSGGLKMNQCCKNCSGGGNWINPLLSIQTAKQHKCHNNANVFADRWLRVEDHQLVNDPCVTSDL